MNIDLPKETYFINNTIVQIHKVETDPDISYRNWKRINDILNYELNKRLLECNEK